MNQDKNIEEFSKFILKEAGTEMPSNNFVHNVMNTISLENSKSIVTIYKPLISKQGWILIAVSLIVLIIFIVTNTTESSIILPSLDVSFLHKMKEINIFTSIKVPSIFIFSSVLFSILVLFQLNVIKKFFDKQNLI